MQSRWSLFRQILAGLFSMLYGASAAPMPPDPPPLQLPAAPPAMVSSMQPDQTSLPVPDPGVKRQEKKNPPLPPLLITKIKTADTEDWVRTPNDLKQLLEWIGESMNVCFSSNIKSFSEVSTDPAKNPILYRSGYKPFRLTPDEAAVLREYVLNGGTIIFNPLVGNPDFYESALQAAHDILPQRPAYRLRLDHPVFHAYYNIENIRCRERMIRDGLAEAHPHLEGVDIDNRTAIFISKWDFACGWESNRHESWGYVDEDARKIGANMVCYVTAMRDAGRSVGKSVDLVDPDKKMAGKFRVGQVTHNGVWKTRTSAFPMLLNRFHKTTGTPVCFELRDVSLADPAIFELPFLYLTGTTDFSFNERERSNLKQFLQNGGMLFAEAGEGRQSFDLSFRLEMARVLPGRDLNALPPSHSLFREPQGIGLVKARSALAARRNNQVMMAPQLFSVEINGTIAVIYSPYDLSAGWERAIAPYALGYEASDATALGINVLFAAVAH